jgi:hypothetical protein
VITQREQVRDGAGLLARDVVAARGGGLDGEVLAGSLRRSQEAYRIVPSACSGRCRDLGFIWPELARHPDMVDLL